MFCAVRLHHLWMSEWQITLNPEQESPSQSRADLVTYLRLLRVSHVKVQTHANGTYSVCSWDFWVPCSRCVSYDPVLVDHISERPRPRTMWPWHGAKNGELNWMFAFALERWRGVIFQHSLWREILLKWFLSRICWMPRLICALGGHVRTPFTPRSSCVNFYGRCSFRFVPWDLMSVGFNCRVARC